MEFEDCDFCGNPFIKGKGHLCWCSECQDKHPMCDPCFKEGIKTGVIKENSHNRNRFSEETLSDMK